jgi:hypothetical protein
MEKMMCTFQSSLYCGVPTSEPPSNCVAAIGRLSLFVVAHFPVKSRFGRLYGGEAVECILDASSAITSSAGVPK